MMRLNAIALTGMFFLITACVDARVIEILSQKQLLDRSDVVVIGRLEKCQDSEKTKEVYANSYVARRATFVVEAVFKGEKVQDRVTLSFYRERTRQDDLDEGKPERKVYGVVNGYMLTGIPDFEPKPVIQKPEFKPGSKAIPKLPILGEAEGLTLTQNNRFYLLYLKRADNDLFEPVSGMDSWQSVYEIHYAKQD